MTHLTAIILTYNEAEHIADCVASVSFADAVLVFDSNSTDDTQQLAQAAGADIATHSFENYAAQRNAALNHVEGTTDWVLFVDADERVTPELAEEVRQVIDQSGNWAGWQIPRHNYIFGKLTRGAGWYPDYQTRLLCVGASRYDPEKIVHEVVLLDGELGTMKSPLIHHNYRDLQHFVQKQRRYSQFDAEILFQQGVRPKWISPLSMAVRQFFWRFVTWRGYKDGWHGLVLSVLMARYEFRKYRLLQGLCAK